MHSPRPVALTTRQALPYSHFAHYLAKKSTHGACVAAIGDNGATQFVVVAYDSPDPSASAITMRVALSGIDLLHNDLSHPNILPLGVS